MDKINSDASTETPPCALKLTAKGRQIRVPSFRRRVNDRRTEPEQFVMVEHELGHIFCGHLGGSESPCWSRHRAVRSPLSRICPCAKSRPRLAPIWWPRAGVEAKSIEYLRCHARKANISVVDLDLIVRSAHESRGSAALLVSRPVNKAVGNVKNNGPELLA